MPQRLQRYRVCVTWPCLLHVGEIDTAHASRLAGGLSGLAGVVEAVVIASEGVAYLKVRTDAWDEAGAYVLIQQPGARA